MDVTIRGTRYGSNIADTLTGTNGDDYLLGRGGADIITGALGADRFLYAEKTDSDVAVANAFDTIKDFTPGTDILDFASTPGLTSIVGNLGTATSLAADSVGWVTSSGTLIGGATGTITTVYANVGSTSELLASGPNMMKIALENVTSLTSANFNLNA